MDEDCGDANANGNAGVVNYNMAIMVSIRVGNEPLWCHKYVIKIIPIGPKGPYIVVMLILMAMWGW